MRICRSGYSCFGMQAWMLLYLYARPDAPIHVLKPSDSYNSMQAQMLLNPYVTLSAPVLVCKPSC